MLRGELQLFAPCPRGLEAALADELTALGASACRITGGGVAFAGDAVLAMAANLHSRIASRILMQVAWGRATLPGVAPPDSFHPVSFFRSLLLNLVRGRSGVSRDAGPLGAGKPGEGRLAADRLSG